MLVPPVNSAAGSIYYIGDPPQNDCDFWIQQYPTYFGERGRVVVEFWNNNEIVAVVRVFFVNIRHTVHSHTEYLIYLNLVQK